MVLFLTIFLLTVICVESCLLFRAAQRLFQFDALFESITTPMEEYAHTLKKITAAEGLLHDHPEVVAFHRANMVLLKQIDAAILTINHDKPKKKNAILPRPEAV